MIEDRVDLKTTDGVMDCRLVVPAAEGRWPAIVFYFDAFGIRPDALDMARRLAAYGFVVMMPNLFYRSGPFAPFQAATAFKDPGERARLDSLIATIDNAKVMRDTSAVLEFLASHRSVRGSDVGCVGYCLGGQFALSAAGTFPDRVRAVASVHGMALAVDRPDSPHLLFSQARARVYVAVAEIDGAFPADERKRLKTALDAAGLSNEVEVYPGTRHGFAVNGRLVYDPEAAERHYQRLSKLFGDTL